MTEALVDTVDFQESNGQPSLELVQPFTEGDTVTSGPESIPIDLDPGSPKNPAVYSVDPVRQYISSIDKIPLLKGAEEEEELSKRIEAGLLAEKMLGLGEEGIFGTTAQTLRQSTGVAKTKKQREVIIQRLATKAEEMDRGDLQQLVDEGRAAKTLMIEANLRLVVSIAGRYKAKKVGKHMKFLDLISEGNIGLMHAVEKFDYAKGYKFSTYATRWIRKAITHAMADQEREIHVPVHVVEQINKRNRVSRELCVQLGRDPTPAELAKELAISEEDLEKMNKTDHKPAFSLERKIWIGDDESPHFGDILEDAGASKSYAVVTISGLDAGLDEIIGTLSPRDQEMVRLRFGFRDGVEHTVEEIRDMMGLDLHSTNIRESLRNSLKKMQAPAYWRQLDAYIEDI